MFIDTHLHESKYSLDSHVSLREIVGRAKEVGLDGICITDHESNEIAAEAKIIAEETDFPIFVGAEVLTYEGDMTVFGLDKLPDKMLRAQDLLDLVREQNGIAICAHPYRQNGRGMGDFMKNLVNPMGVEAFNGNTPLELNLKAYQVAQELGLPMLGGSDAHNKEQVGKFATLFPKETKTVRDLITAVKENRVYPAILESGKYRVIYRPNKASQIG